MLGKSSWKNLSLSLGALNSTADPRDSGLQDTQLSDTANGVLYGCFAIMGFFAGSVNVSADSCTLVGRRLFRPNPWYGLAVADPN